MKYVKNCLIFFPILLFSLSGFTQSEYIFAPKTTFDKNLAKFALESGNSILSGQISYRDAAKKNQQPQRILLYPVNNFLNECHAFRLQNIGFQSKEIYAYEPEAEEFKLLAESDKSGYFTFKNLKIGKYYLEAIFTYTKDISKDVYVGNSTNLSGTTNYYERKNISKDYSVRLEEFIEIKKEGEIKKIKLSKRQY